MTTAFFSHPDCLRHDMGEGHPESPARLESINDWLVAKGRDLALEMHDAPLADLADIERAHSHAHVARLKDVLQRVEASGRARMIDPDTVACEHTWRAALRAAGAAAAATDLVVAGACSNAFCAVRPPGHHATRDAAMGFCFFNNVAVAAHRALQVHGLERVAIVDFDVHHGNGTEDIVAGDERILMASFFQHPLYPGSGSVPKGTNMVNVPVPPYTRGAAVRALIEAHWTPRLEDFEPQMVFVSAGFDAHRDDPLAQLALVEDDYDWITRYIAGVADRHAQGRIVSSLEGGYDLRALRESVGAHLRVLAGL